MHAVALEELHVKVLQLHVVSRMLNKMLSFPICDEYFLHATECPYAYDMIACEVEVERGNANYFRVKVFL